MSDTPRLIVGNPHTPMNEITPRQVLMMALASVDEFDCVVVVMGKREGADIMTRVNTSSANIYEALGMLTDAQHVIKSPEDHL